MPAWYSFHAHHSFWRFFTQHSVPHLLPVGASRYPKQRKEEGLYSVQGHENKYTCLSYPLRSSLKTLRYLMGTSTIVRPVNIHVVGIERTMPGPRETIFFPPSCDFTDFTTSSELCRLHGSKSWRSRPAEQGLLSLCTLTTQWPLSLSLLCVCLHARLSHADTTHHHRSLLSRTYVSMCCT